jgi:hypothetical protein
MKSKVGNKLSYLLLFLLLAFSGNPVFTQNKLFLIIFGVLLIIALLFSKIKINFLFKKRLFQYVFYFLIIFFLQYIVLDFVSFEGVINFYFKILVGAIIVYLLGYSFREKYLNLMSFLGVISIVGFLINFFGVRIPSIFEVNNNSSIILFGTYNAFFDAGPMRNSGMFWEPGAYSGYILLIPLFYLGDLNELWNLHKKKCLLMIIVLLTTSSTTGYTTFFLILLYYLMVKSKKKFIVYLGLPFILAGIYSIYTQVDFLGDKIESQAESSLSSNSGKDFSADRFGAFAFDIYYINKHPLIGNGIHSKTRYADHQYLITDEDSGIRSHGNGFSNFVASMGIVSMILLFYLIYKRYPFAKRDSIFLILIVAIMLQGEQFLNYPLFLVLPFIMIPSKNEFKINKNSTSPYLPQS